jgi:hypothetical protein
MLTRQDLITIIALLESPDLKVTGNNINTVYRLKGAVVQTIKEIEQAEGTNGDSTGTPE